MKGFGNATLAQFYILPVDQTKGTLKKHGMWLAEPSVNRTIGQQNIHSQEGSKEGLEPA